MRAAIESLPYETPNIATMDGKSFAEALDRAIERSKLPPMLNAPTIELVDATELKKPMSRYFEHPLMAHDDHAFPLRPITPEGNLHLASSGDLAISAAASAIRRGWLLLK
jgi:hypothetical protein